MLQTVHEISQLMSWPKCLPTLWTSPYSCPLHELDGVTNTAWS